MSADSNHPSLHEQLEKLLTDAEETSVWVPAPVSERPELELSSWTAYTVAGCVHLVGYNETERSGRVSSPIVAYDEATGVTLTRSGRVYRLLGTASPHPDRDGAYVFDRWLEINGFSRDEVMVSSIQGLPAVDEETLRLLAARQAERQARREAAVQATARRRAERAAGTDQAPPAGAGTDDDF